MSSEVALEPLQPVSLLHVPSGVGLGGEEGGGEDPCWLLEAIATKIGGISVEVAEMPMAISGGGAEEEDEQSEDWGLSGCGWLPLEASVSI